MMLKAHTTVASVLHLVDMSDHMIARLRRILISQRNVSRSTRSSVGDANVKDHATGPVLGMRTMSMKQPRLVPSPASAPVRILYSSSKAAWLRGSALSGSLTLGAGSASARPILIPTLVAPQLISARATGLNQSMIPRGTALRTQDHCPMRSSAPVVKMRPAGDPDSCWAVQP